MPFAMQRSVGFDEIDAAGLLYFPRFLSFCHEAMELVFDQDLDGGYVRLVRDRKLGLPAVHVEIDFTSPLRYGDVVQIAVEVTHVGTSSTTFRYAMTRADDARAVAVVTHVCVVTDLVLLKAVPIPDDVRKVLEKHLAGP